MKHMSMKAGLFELALLVRKVFVWTGARCVELLNVPLWLVSLVVPKSDNIWIFGAWDGRKYSDNPKWLNEYVRTQIPEVRPVWLSKSKVVVETLRKKGIEAYQTYSLYGYWFSARAKVGIVCVGFGDINRFVVPPLLINTWHGTPVKKVGEQVHAYRAQVQTSWVGAFAYQIRTVAHSLLNTWFEILPFSSGYRGLQEKRFSFFTANSAVEAELLKKSFGNIEVKVTGQPRNDVLSGSFKLPSARENGKRRILYLPTHRFSGRVQIVPHIVDGIEKVVDMLTEVDAEMIIKLHTFHEYEIQDLARAINGLQNITVLVDDETLGDVYPILRSADILITDYSSVYVDYLLTGRPIIFFPFDLDEYMSKERTFNFEYMSITPGPKCWDWESVALWIKRFCEDPSLYLEERLRLKSLFHAFDDGRNCERVVGAIKELLSEKNMCDALDVYYTATSRNQTESHRCQQSGKPKQK